MIEYLSRFKNKESDSFSNKDKKKWIITEKRTTSFKHDRSFIAKGRILGFTSRALTVAEAKLESFLSLEFNWNGNNAEPFNLSLINKAKFFLSNLDSTPDIFPTARKSIQFEYEEGEMYLEFEIYEDQITYYFEKDGKEEEGIVHNVSHANKLRREVFDG